MSDWRTELGAKLLGLAGWRFAILLLPLLFTALPWASFSTASFAANFHGATVGPPTLASHWATWDAQHYLYLAREGYTAGHVSSSFWPLWPLLIRAAAHGLRISELAAALGVANLLALAASAGLWLLLRERSSPSNARVATWAVLLQLAFPSAFFLGLPYSEALFLALVVGLFLALQRNRWGWAAAAAFLLPLARPVGLFILVPLAVWVLERRPAGSEGHRGRLGLGPRLALLAAPLAGTGAYFGFHLLATGEPLGAFAVRGIWVSGQALSRLWDLMGLLQAFVAVDRFHSITGSALDRALFVLVAAALPWLWRRDRVWFAYTLSMAAVPALTLHFMAFNRFALVLFPVFWAAAEWLCGWRSAMLRVAVPALGLGVQFWLFWRHSLALWAG